jgi:hypothetical protein
MKLYWFIKFKQNFAFSLDDSLKKQDGGEVNGNQQRNF